ncbi:MAG: hypothetical protein EA424_19955 [Planctomycetaceae bacterium]|nr:MAG: hypothetical protein EA424_19955 [Planctomycetaceae bacterium]
MRRFSRSRLPVGSSAKRISGSTTIVRAIATRCRVTIHSCLACDIKTRKKTWLTYPGSPKTPSCWNLLCALSG